MKPTSRHPRAVSVLAYRALTILAAALLVAGCPTSHDPEDPRPACPEGEDVEWGAACTTQDDCEPSYCGRLGGVCVDNGWTCGECGLCFFGQIQHTENTFMACNMDTGLCE